MERLKQPAMMILDRWSALLMAVVVMHVIAAPFTKVEESFNLQATHDLLYHGTDRDSYDHLQFPGVVPRTFLGAMALAATSAAPVAVAHACGATKLISLVIVRICLGAIVVCCMLSMRSGVAAAYGYDVGVAFVVVTAAQFHLPFYASRTLPNTFALAAVALACRFWLLRRRPAAVVAWLAATTVIMRCDMLLLAACIGLHMLATRQISLMRAVVVGTAAVLASVAVSVAVDSWFWKRWLWPEGEVLWFNTVLNKSSEWGVAPMHWYATSAMPRSLLAAAPLALVGVVVEPRARSYLAAATAFVALYSLLAHKEVRFLFPVLPLFNMAAAVAVARMWRNRGKSLWRRLQWLLVVGMLACSAACSAVMLYVSSLNYPGGAAMLSLHRMEGYGLWWYSSMQRGVHGAAKQFESGIKGTPRHAVHIDVLAAMTGTSRFLHMYERDWVYNKTEDLKPQQLHGSFSHLLSETKHVPGFEVTESVYGYAGMRGSRSPAAIVAALLRLQMPFEIAMAPRVHVLRLANHTQHRPASNHRLFGNTLDVRGVQ